MNSEKTSKSKKIILAVSSGIALGLSYPPVPAPFLAVVAFVPFFILFDEIENYKEAFQFTFLTFFILSLITLYWVGAFNIRRDTYFMITGVGLVLIVPIWLFISTGSWFFIRRRLGRTVSVISFPFLWISLDYIQTKIELSFPWLLLGHTQTTDLSAIQMASYIGVFGISFWILMINVFIYLLFYQISKRGWRWRSWKSIISFVLILALYFLPKIYGHYVLSSSHSDWYINADTLRVGVVQPNIDPYEKWEGNIEKQLSILQRLTDTLSKNNPDLILWPETAVPTYILFPTNSEYYDRVRSQVDKLELNLLTGITDWYFYSDGDEIPKSSKWIEGGQRYDIYNTSILFIPHYYVHQTYHKMHLVPFAERIPWAEELSFLNLDVIRWNFGASGYGIGDDTTIFSFCSKNLNEVKFSTMICYESVFPEFVTDFVRKGSQFLVVITNDNWWGNTSGVYQHNQFDVLRAVENRRWVVRCNNGGISCFIDPYGVIHQPTKYGTQATIHQDIQALSNMTFYSKHGDYIARICLIISILLLTLSFGKKLYTKFR